MRKSLSHFALFAGVFLSLVVISGRAAGLGRGINSWDPAIEDKDIKKIERKESDILFLGNSMVGEGVRKRIFTNLSGLRVSKLSFGGAASAWWYLAVKNVILASRHRPPVVVLVFRDFFLTEPSYRTRGKYKLRLDAIAGEKEPLLDELAFMNTLAPVPRALTLHVPLYRKRQEFQRWFENAVKTSVAAPLGLTGKDVEAALERVFDDEKMNSERLSLAQLRAEEREGEAADFAQRLKGSFLPEIIRLTEQNGIRLVLVRYKRKRDVIPGREPPALVRYVEDLRTYLDRRAVPFIDLTRDGRIVGTHYGVGDHMNREGSVVLTEILYEELRPYLPAPGGATGGES